VKFTAFLTGSVSLAAVFVLFPDIDLWFSGLFYEHGRGFHLDDALWVQFLYHSIPILAIAVSISLILMLGFTLLSKRSVGPLGSRTTLYLLAVLALGPGLVVHTVFKDQWDRARPRDVVEFGGEKRFTPAFVISDQCERNCSFVAGHPSMGFYFMALALIARRRRTLYAVAIGLGSLAGLGRIVQGAHFLSDVVFSGIFVFLVAYLLYRYAFRLAGRGTG
jgi:lipid A 4'-phosphatase